MSTNNDNENDKLINILSCLQAYSQIHANGNKSMKNCTWNIFKSRRDTGGLHLGNDSASAFSAYAVREDLRASALLQVNSDDTQDTFILRSNKIAMREEDKENHNSDNTLRQRKKESKNNESIWTTEELLNEDDAEEQYLRTIDPIVLFNGGMSPPSLKEAQKDARNSLEYYIEAANLICAMMKLMEK